MIDTKNWWDVELDNKPDIRDCLKRIYAWFEKKIIDRSPIRFVSNNILKTKKQLSCNCMRSIPTYGEFFITACDFSTILSNQMFEEYALPSIKRLTSNIDHNVFRLDGKGVAKHIDYIFQIPEIDGIQWVQGIGKYRPILQWIPLIKKILQAEKSIIVDIDKKDLDNFIDEIKNPNGVFLFIESNSTEEQQKIIKRIEKW